MSEIRTAYHTNSPATIELLPIQLGLCPACGGALLIWKVQLLYHEFYELLLQPRCRECSAISSTRHIRLVPTLPHQH